MSIEFLGYLSYLLFFLGAAIIVWLVAMLIMHFFVPKAMLLTYFREPYFSRSEIAVYSAFPFNYFRDIMFMRLAGWPNSGKKRGLTEAYKLAPPWFRHISKILIRMILVIYPPTIILGIFLAVAL